MQIGGFMYPFSDLATPKAELVKHLGYQDDPAAAEKEAKALMAAAGHPNGIQGLDASDPRSRQLSCLVAGDPGDAAADAEHHLQSAVRGRIGVVRRHRHGHFDLAIGAVVSTLLDPSDGSTPGTTRRPQNYSSYSNPKVDALIDQIDREVDPRNGRR